MKKKLIIKSLIFFSIIIPLLFLIINFSLKIFEYKKYTNSCYKYIPYCSIYTNTHYFEDETVDYGNFECFKKMYHLLLPKLLVYKTKRNNKPIWDFYKVSNSFSLSNYAISLSDAVLSWGIGEEWEVKFEEYVSYRYKIPVYLFDCGVKPETLDKLSKKFKAEGKNICIQNECLGCDKYLLYGAKSSKKIHSFSQKLKELNLEDKKVYLKLGIPEPQEYIEDILKHKDNITGISVNVDIWSSKHCLDILKFFNALNNDFILVSRKVITRNAVSGNFENDKDIVSPNIKYINPKNIFHYSLVYINKNYIDSAYLPLIQNNANTGYNINLTRNKLLPYSSIDSIVVFFEKIKALKNKRSKN